MKINSSIKPDRNLKSCGEENAGRPKTALPQAKQTPRPEDKVKLSCPQKRGSLEGATLPSSSTFAAGSKSPSKEGRPERGRTTPRPHSGVHRETSLPASSTSVTGSKSRGHWTVLAYYAGDCNLERQMAQDVKNLEKAGAPSEMNVLVQLDRGAHPTSEFQSKPGMVRYYLQKSGQETQITSPELKDLKTADAADPEVLEEFLSFGMKNYPAQNYLVYIAGHGFGVGGLITDEGTRSRMSLPDFHRALKNAEKEAGVERNRVFLTLESCNMAQAEVACELQDSARKMLASQSEDYPACGMLPETLSQKSVSGLTPDELMEKLLSAGELLTTRSIIDLNRMPEVKKGVKGLVEAIKNSPAPPESIKRDLTVKSRPLYFEYFNTYHAQVSDLSDIARQLSKDPQIKDAKLKKAALRLKTALDEAIPAVCRREGLEYGKNSYGLGITAASEAKVYDQAYRELDFERDTGWGDFMSAYAPQTGPKEPAAGLKQPVIQYPQLKAVSRLAKEALLDLPGLEQEFKSIETYDLAKEHRLFRKMDKLNRQAPARYRDILGKIMDRMINNYQSIGHVKTALLVLSALEGEISPQTLGKAASNLEQASFEQRNRRLAETGKLMALDPERRESGEPGLQAMLESETESENINLIKKQMDGAYFGWAFHEGLGRDNQEFGEELLTILGFSARNEQVVNLNNYRKNDLAHFKTLGGAQPLSPVEKALKLPDRTVKYPQLKEMAETAQKGLDDFSELEKEILPAGREIYALYTTPPVTQETRVKIYQRAAQIGMVKQLDKINRKVKSPQDRRLVGAVLTGLIRKNPGTPESLSAYLKAGLTVISALEGEVGSRTLAGAADKILHTPPKNQEEEGDLSAAGALAIEILGNLSGNLRVQALQTDDHHDYLESIARLDKLEGDKATYQERKKT